MRGRSMSNRRRLLRFSVDRSAGGAIAVGGRLRAVCRHNTSMEPALLIGIIAATLTTVAFVPQVVRVWRTRSTHDISGAMFGIFSMGVVCWLGYGIVLGAWPIIIANIVTLALSLTILYFKIRYK